MCELTYNDIDLMMCIIDCYSADAYLDNRDRALYYKLQKIRANKMMRYYASDKTVNIW